MIHDLGDNLIPVLAIGCTFLFFMVWVCLATVDSIYKTKCNLRLKQMLVERGASATEITQIIRAGTDTEEDASTYVQPVPPVKSNAYPLSS
jgi:hypothetical protein